MLTCVILVRQLLIANNRIAIRIIQSFHGYLKKMIVSCVFVFNWSEKFAEDTSAFFTKKPIEIIHSKWAFWKCYQSTQLGTCLFEGYVGQKNQQRYVLLAESSLFWGILTMPYTSFGCDNNQTSLYTCHHYAIFNTHMYSPCCYFGWRKYIAKSIL